MKLIWTTLEAAIAAHRGRHPRHCDTDCHVSAWVRIDSEQQAATWGGIRIEMQDENWNALGNVMLTPATSPIG